MYRHIRTALPYLRSSPAKVAVETHGKSVHQCVKGKVRVMDSRLGPDGGHMDSPRRAVLAGRAPARKQVLHHGVAFRAKVTKRCVRASGKLKNLETKKGYKANERKSEKGRGPHRLGAVTCCIPREADDFNLLAEFLYRTFNERFNGLVGVLDEGLFK